MVSLTRISPALRTEALDHIADSLVVRPQVAPAAAVAVAIRTSREWELSHGAAGLLDRLGTAPAAPDTPFDLASLTKSFVAVAAVRLAAAGTVRPEAPLAEYLPELGDLVTGSATVELCLAHRAGLVAHVEAFRPLQARRAVHRGQSVLALARARRADCDGPAPPAGWPPTYSDLGYFLVGHALERATGVSLDRIVEAEVTAPLGLDVGSARQWLGAERGFTARVAPTEYVPWRGGGVRGRVHDENAWALAGFGTAGHAGLFGTAASIAAWGAHLLDALAGRSSWLERRWMERLVAPRPGGTLRAGFDGRSPDGSSAGIRASADAFGHLGFTGTSFWCDPRAEAVAVLLANRVCPSRANALIRGARPAVHDALFAWVSEARGTAS